MRPLSSSCFWADTPLTVVGPEASGVSVTESVAQRGCCPLTPRSAHSQHMLPLTHCREQGGLGDNDSERSLHRNACRQCSKLVLTFLSTQWSLLTCFTLSLLLHWRGLPRKAIHSSSCPCGLSSYHPRQDKGQGSIPVLSSTTLTNHNLPSQLESLSFNDRMKRTREKNENHTRRKA